jgi:hypothetical protein
MRALKFNQTATIEVNLGDGINVGVLFESSNTAVATINSSGVITPQVNPLSSQGFIIVIREETSRVILSALSFIVVPEDVPQERIEEVNTGQLSFKEIFDVTGPTGGSLDLEFNGTQLVVNFTSPIDEESGISGLFLTIVSSDLTEVKANRLNVLELSSPRYFNVSYGKIYVVTLRALNADGLIREITDSIEIPVGWNKAPWNLAGFGI